MTTGDTPDSIFCRTDIMFRKVASRASVSVAIIALAGLLGYVSGLQLLGSIRPDYIPMAPGTALCFLFASAALFFHVKTFLHGPGLTTLLVLVIVATVFSLLEFVEFFVGVDLNHSDKLFPVRDMSGAIPAGRMSPATAATFCIAGLSVLLLMVRGRTSRKLQLGNVASGLGLLTMLAGATVLLAYLYGTPLMYGGATIPMAVTTAAAFVLLAVAIVASAGPDSFLARRLTGNTTPALLSRVFIPLVLAIVIFQSLLSRHMSISFMINEALIKAFIVVVTSLITAFAVDRVADSIGGNIDEVNRRLHQSLKDLHEREEHHRDILHTAMDGIILADSSGRVQEVNEAYCRMSGYTVDELTAMSMVDLAIYEQPDGVTARIRSIMEQGEIRYESRHRRKNGSTYDIEVSAKYRPKGNHLVLFFRDISEQKLRYAAHQETENWLQLASMHSNLHECVAALTASLQNWTGCEAVGIRLRAGDDFPYFETRGFPARFVQMENHLCVYGPDGAILRDAEGKPVLECMCGNVLSGRFDPSQPFFTARGSFWSNNTSVLLATTTEADRQAHTRNRCNSAGYESVALVPMRAGEQIIGLLQFNDHRADRFTPALIDIFEGLADKIALALTWRQAEKELNKREKLHHDLLNTIPDLIWLKDADGVYLSCNATFERFVNAKESDIAGKTDYDFFDKELADFFREHDRRAMTADMPSSNEEWITFADDGHRALLYTTKMPMHDSEGKLIGIIGVGRDITRLRQAEETVRESESRLRYALEGTNDGVWDVQMQSGKVYMSPRGCEILGYRGDELEGVAKAWSDLVHPDDLQITSERLQEHIDGRAEIFDVEQRLKTKDGGWKWIHARGKVVERDADGQPLRMTGTHSDISDKKLLEAQLHQAQKMESVGRLAGGVAHDFNNMLGVILGRTALALMETDPVQPIHEHLVEIHNAAERSADLTRQLLAFARKQTITPKVLDLNDTIAGMIKILQRLIGEDVQLCWQPGNNLGLIKMDPSQIDQILANLCVNARDAIENTGKIFIETGTITIDAEYCTTHPDAVPGDFVVLSVSDDGCGMDAETLTHIYEPFYTTKRLGEGTGLGLATVYGAVKQNDGFMNVYSELGRGTTFTLYIPRYNDTAGQAPKEGVSMPPSRGHETIMLVEDEPAILKMSVTILEKQGYTVLASSSPQDAIRMAHEHSGAIHLLMTDVIMPGMNGRDLATVLTTDHPQIKLLFMSGYTADVIAHHGVLDDGVHFIQKPFSLPGLAVKVREVLDSWNGAESGPSAM